MKKVLVISGSTRRGGNSDALCDEFVLGAKEAGNSAEKVFLADYKINYCLGCDYCAAHQGTCCQKDDMAQILDKMVKADVIVLASPVYFYTINALMKNFIDRTVARYTEITDKEFYYIVTAADTDKENLRLSIDCFKGFTVDCLDGAKEMGEILATGVWKKGEVLSTEFMKQARNMGKGV